MKFDDPDTLGAFFGAFDKQSDALDEQLSDFFRTLERDYRSARTSRAANTPHLDVLRIFGLQFAELRHSDTLAWFLDPTVEHEQGPRFANALIQHLGLEPVTDELYTVRRECHGRTDVACYSRKRFAIFIENKVRSGERKDQFSDMVGNLVTLSEREEIPLERRFAIFLTDSGVPPKTAPTADSLAFSCKNVVLLNRVKLFELFHDALQERPAQCRSPLLMNFLDCYLNAIRRIRTEIS